MKKSLIFGLFGTTVCAVAAGISPADGGKINSLANGTLESEWVHYKQVDATETKKGTREYWVQCGGAYQFEAPAGVTPREAGKAPDTSEFEIDDPRYITYVKGSVFYNMATSAWDYREVGTALDGYSAVKNVDTTKYGEKLNAVYVKDGEPSLMVEQLTVTKVLTTAADVTALNVNSNGTPYEYNNGKEIVGYYVFGCDISGYSLSAAWNDDCHDHRFVGVIDGRGKTLISPYVGEAGGMFSARKCDQFTIKDLVMTNVGAGNYGLFGYQVDNMTLIGVRASAGKNNHPSAGLLGNIHTNLKMTNCYFDNLINKKAIINDAITPKFVNTTIVTDFHNAPMCNLVNNRVYTENYDEEGINWSSSSYKAVGASPATYEHGGHEAGYYCEVCEKFFEDAHHQNEMTVTDPLPSTKVVGKQIFWNLTTSAFDASEVSGLDTTKLVAGDGSALSFTGAKAGDVKRTFLPGETTYEYELVVVTDVIDEASDFSTKFDASAKDVEGYFVMVNDMDAVKTSTKGSNTTQTSVKVTIDYRNHTINTLDIKNGAGGFFGSLGAGGHEWNVVFKNLTAKKVTCAAYGMFGWGPTSNGTTHSLLLENCDLTAGGTSNRYGLIGHDSRNRISLKNCIFDFSKNEFSGGEEVYSGSFLFCAGSAYPVMENVTMIIIEAHDTYKNNYTEGSKTYTDVVKPDAVIGGKSADERTGLNSKMAGLTFLTARA